MPYKDISKRKAVVAASVRRLRIFRKALAQNYPKAVAAERERQRAANPMQPLHDLEKRLLALPKEARQAHRAEHEALRRECALIDRDAARARYVALREEVIDEAMRAPSTGPAESA